jgi:hypothetical protein
MKTWARVVTPLVAVLGLTLGGCAEAISPAVWFGAELVNWCVADCPLPRLPQRRPVCPPGVDPAAVTWCRVVQP